MHKILVSIGLAASVNVAHAAELPSRGAKPPAKVERCEIAGKPGVLSADGQTCIRVSGYDSSQFTKSHLK